jgi:hypothetical protein
VVQLEYVVAVRPVREAEVRLELVVVIVADVLEMALEPVLVLVQVLQ